MKSQVSIQCVSIYTYKVCAYTEVTFLCLSGTATEWTPTFQLTNVDNPDGYCSMSYTVDGKL